MRSLHTHPGHRNPGYGDEMGDGHIHFPTEQHPLVQKRSVYAYKVDCPDMNRLTDYAEYACALWNIHIDNLQLQLDTGGRR